MGREILGATMTGRVTGPLSIRIPPSNPVPSTMARTKSAESLQEALDGMSWEVLEGRFALVGFEGPVRAEDLALLGTDPSQIIREGGETTLLVAKDLVQPVRERHPDARVEAPLAWIRFRAPMGWEVVGFLARVTSALAEAGVPLGAVCGYSRDHLFVAEHHLERTRQVLAQLFGPASR